MTNRPVETPPSGSPTWYVITVGPRTEPAVNVITPPRRSALPRLGVVDDSTVSPALRAVGVGVVGEHVDRDRAEHVDRLALVDHERREVLQRRLDHADDDRGGRPQVALVGHLVRAPEHAGRRGGRRERDALIARDRGAPAGRTTRRADQRRAFAGRVAVVAQHVERDRHVDLGGDRVVAGVRRRGERLAQHADADLAGHLVAVGVAHRVGEADDPRFVVVRRSARAANCTLSPWIDA